MSVRTRSLTDIEAAYVAEFVARALGPAACERDLPPDLVELLFKELSRQEEVLTPTRDQWRNWEWPFSDAARKGTLYRPVVDEQVLEWIRARGGSGSETLAAWPDGRPFALCLTHDVDFISRRSTSLAALLDRLRRIAAVPAGQRPAAIRSFARECARFILGPALRRHGQDEFHNFDTWMAVEAEYGFRSTFFFLAEHLRSPHVLDSGYRYSQRLTFEGETMSVAQMMRLMRERGWEVGLHGSIHSATDLALLKDQKGQLECVLGEEVPFIRHHYLTYDPAVSPALHEQAGFRVDSTHGFNRNIGFRAGTSLPYFCWDHGGRRSTNVLEVPMIIQDVALFNANALECDPAHAAKYIVTLMDAVERVGGCLTVNWHPSWWSDDRYAGSYRFLLDEARRRGAWGAGLGDLECRASGKR